MHRFVYKNDFLKSKTGFALTTAKTRAKIYYDVNDALVIKRSAELFARDIQMVTGQKPELIQKGKSQSSGYCRNH